MPSPAPVQEHVIAVIPGTDPTERIIFASNVNGAIKPLVLRRESFSPDVGWFVQRTLELTREEMVAIRGAMGGSAPRPCQQTRLRATSSRPAGPDAAVILSIEAARGQRACTG